MQEHHGSAVGRSAFFEGDMQEGGARELRQDGSCGHGRYPSFSEMPRCGIVSENWVARTRAIRPELSRLVSAHATNVSSIPGRSRPARLVLHVSPG